VRCVYHGRYTTMKYLLTLAILVTVHIGHSATLSNIYKGSTTLASGSGSITQAITSVDLSQSFLIFSVRVKSHKPGDFQIGGYLSADDEITFHRYNTSGAPVVEIEWQVFEFSSGVSVQRGTVTNLVASGANVSLSPSINTSSSFVTLNMRKDGSSYGSDDGVTGVLTSGSNLYIDRESGGADPQHVHWQVIEWTGTSVQTVSGTLSAGSDSLAVTLSSAVDKDKTMVIGNYRLSGDVVSADLVSTELYDDNTVIFTRTGTQRNIYPYFYVVEFSDDTDVVHGAVRILSGESDVSTTICSVDAASSGIINPSDYGRSAGNCNFSSDDMGYGWTTLTIDDDVTVRAERPSTGYAARVPFQVLEFTASTPTGCTPPEPGASTPRTTNGNGGLCLFNLPVELIAFEAEAFGANISKLSWTTASEIDNDFFEIERSSNNADFVPVGTVAGSGTTNAIHYYHWSDQVPSLGTFYYRIKQVDFDGESDYSWTESVTFTAQSPLTLYPNPAADWVTIRTQLDDEGDIRIYDQIGRTVYSSPLQSSSNQIDIHLMTRGLYTVVVSSGRFVATETLVID
jgi:hypothetical protein